MTIKDILEGYGVDFKTLRFETVKGAQCSAEEIRKQLSENILMIDGELIRDYEIYADEPLGFVELYII